jgi:predicted outer membrane repeat protein
MKFFLRSLIGFVFCFYSFDSFSQTIIYVDPLATGLKNGSSWANAYTSLDDALDHAKSLTGMDTIKVAQGIYQPARFPGGIASVDPRDKSFLLPKYSAIIGGYANGGGTRDPKKFKSILSGDIGIAGDSSDNAYHVILGIKSMIAMDGFTIRDGNAIGTGVYMVDSITVNRNEGGGVYSYETVGELTDLKFLNNSAESGGAVSITVNSDISFANCFFLNNLAGKEGGGVFINSNSVTVFNNSVFYENSAQENGGAISNHSVLQASIQQCTLVKNSVWNKGGAVYNQGSTTNISNTLFALNYIFLPEFSILSGSDIEDSSAVTTLDHCFLQVYEGTNSCISGELAVLNNPDNPYGSDGILGTADDGLHVSPASLAFKAGYYGLNDKDITGVERPGSFDIGAYESGECAGLTGRTVFVDSSATGNNSGGSWNNAFTELQSALNLAYFGCVDTIKVAKGTYMPLNPPRSDNGARASYYSFTIPDGITMLGGYAPGGGQRNPLISKTILSAFQKAGYYNSVHVVMITYKTNVTLDGFIIENGDAGYEGNTSIDGKNYPKNEGGGLLIYNSSVQLKNCQVNNNISANTGAGISANNSLLSVYHCQFENNTSESGGAISFVNMVEGSVIRSSTFSNNTGHNTGGAISFLNTTPVITLDSCTFLQNVTTGNDQSWSGGGAIYCNGINKLQIDHSLFDGNKAWNGGAIYQESSNAGIDRCVFNYNQANGKGGSVYNPNGTVRFSSSVFIRNSAAISGGAVYSNSVSQYYFCTFFQNSAKSTGGALYSDWTMLLYNSIFYKNGIGVNILSYGTDVYSTGDWDPRNNLFQAETNASAFWGNVRGVEPMFIDTTSLMGPDKTWGTRDDGLNLKLESPLVNKLQYYMFPDWLQTDIAGRNRVSCKYPDMGAYENEDCSYFEFVNSTVYVDSSAVNGKNNGKSWEDAFTSIESAFAIVDSFALDTIKIAKGTYHPISQAGFVIPFNRVLLGGYPNGGGIRDFNSNPTILINSLNGPVLYIIKKGKITLDGLILENPQYVSPGGSAIHAENTDLLMNNLRVRNNKNGPGYAVYLNNCSGTVMNCSFINNYSDMGSALSNAESSIKYINCVFYNNSSRAFAGAVRTTGNSAFINCTFYKNYSLMPGGSGAMLSITSTAVLRNCIFWGNRVLGIYRDFYNNDMSQSYTFVPANISNSLFEFPTQEPLTNSMNGVYPGFADTLNILGQDGILGTLDDGILLKEASFAINKGVNAYLPNDVVTDIAGQQRIVSDTIDLGAYEFATSNSLPVCEVIQPDFEYRADSLNSLKITFTDLTPANRTDHNNAIKWLFGDGDSSVSFAPVHVYRSPGTYVVKMSYSGNGGCQKDTSKTITIVPASCNLHVLFTYSGNLVAPATIHFINQSAADSNISYKWYFGTGDSSALKEPSYSYTQPGIFNIRLVGSEGKDCIKSYDTSIVIVPSLICQTEASFLINGSLQAPANLNFTNTSKNASLFQWNFGDGSVSIQLNPTHTYNSAGIYMVELIAADSAGCADTIFKQVTILNKIDTCTLKASYIFFADSSNNYSISFVNTSSTNLSTKLSWDFGDGTVSDLLNPTHNYPGEGVYRVCLKLQDSICTSSYCKDVTIVSPLITPISLYPNPATDQLTVKFDLPIEDDVDFLIYNDGGVLVNQIRRHAQSGMNMMELDISNLKRGLYFLNINSNKNPGYSVKFYKL